MSTLTEGRYDDMGEKGEQLHMERTATRTPPSEVEKQEMNLIPTRSAGPPVHEKARIA